MDSFVKSNEKQMVIENRNSFHRRLIFQLIENEFDHRISTQTKPLDKYKVSIIIERKRTHEQDYRLDEEKCKEEWKELELLIGMRSVLKLISESVWKNNFYK